MQLIKYELEIALLRNPVYHIIRIQVHKDLFLFRHDGDRV